MSNLKAVFAIVLCVSSVLALAVGPQKPKHPIGAKAASRAALKRYPGKVVGRVALENEDGKWQYSVNIRSGHTLREVMVDSISGKIASVEVTTPSEEAREAAAEKTRGHKKPK